MSIARALSFAIRLSLRLDMALFIVEKSDLENHPEFRGESTPFCLTVRETDLVVIFEPKAGYLATFGVMLTEKGISYQLEFVQLKDIP